MAELTWSEFKVDLAQLHQAIGTVGHEAGLIEDYMSRIAAHFSQVKEFWNTPTELSFEEVQQWFTRVQRDLLELLKETVRRLQAAYNNYHAAELANTNNLQTFKPGDQGGNRDPSAGPRKESPSLRLDS